MRISGSCRCSSISRNVAHTVTALLVLLGTTIGSLTEAQQSRVRYVTTAKQRGPVAYRDPLGVPSPDGRWLATHVGLRLRVELLAGGPVRELGDGRRRRLHLAWRPDSQTLVAREADRERTWFDWSEYDAESGMRTRLWPERGSLLPPQGVAADRGDLSEVAFAADGSIVGLVARDGGRQLWIFDQSGAVLETIGDPAALSNVVWKPNGGVACVDASGEHPLLSLDCGRAPGVADLGEVRGPVAFDGDDGVFVGRPNDRGTLDLWRLDLESGTAEQISHFTRDTYAPYALPNGRLLFKLQEDAVTIARVAAAGGTAIPVTTFQSETPSWDWTGEHIAFTYGSWRRVVDDVHYPDIAQHVGTVRVRDGIADEAQEVVRSSYSEDQGMHWSPNGRWIALHSHADGTDDIWLQPADGSAAAVPITGGGNETGWPRFSPDGRWIVYSTDRRVAGEHHGVLQLVGFDQETGEITQPQRDIELTDFDGLAGFAEFGADSRTIFFEGMHGVGERAVWKVDRDGGRPELVHRYASEQWATGISVSPDSDWVAYVAPAGDGRMQLFRVPSTGGDPVQITFDPSDKTHPSWSPRGDQIAFTVFRYLAHFWLFEP